MVGVSAAFMLRISLFVLLSTNLFLFTSTSKSKCPRKSAPMIGLPTSAITNSYVNFRANPRSTVKRFVPKVAIVVLFAANSVRLLACNRSRIVGGITDISAPVSIKYRLYELLSTK